MIFSMGRMSGVMKVRSPLKTAAMYLPSKTEAVVNREKKMIAVRLSE